jgi:hypothetical protein
MITASSARNTLSLDNKQNKPKHKKAAQYPLRAAFSGLFEKAP